jgi:hypothetical protein
LPTVKGDVAVSWQRDGSSFSLQTSVPSNATAEITLPGRTGGWTTMGAEGMGDILADASARGRAGVLATNKAEDGVSLEVAGPRQIRLTALG